MRKGSVFLIGVIVVFGIFVFWNGFEISGKVIDDAGLKIERSENFSVYKIKFNGIDGKDIYGMFFVPFKEEFDVVVVLPAAEGTKESRRFYGEILSEMGYGALILDQRGIGETNGRVNSLEEDFNAFLKKKEVYQLLMAKDVIGAIDFLDNIKGVDEFAVLGESMGGRNAIISAGLDKRIKSAIIISSSGHRGSFGNVESDRFLEHINPNSYIGRISPRRLLMLHAINDSVIPIANVRYTFSLAKEPKNFVEFADKECKHGYCKPMYEFIENELNEAFR